MRRLFNKFDSDQSGFLDDSEIKALLKETYTLMGMSNYVPSDEDVKLWIQMTDTNNDNLISLQEYEDLIISSLEK